LHHIICFKADILNFALILYTLYIIQSLKEDAIQIFSIFKKKDGNQTDTNVSAVQNIKSQTRLVLEDAKVSLEKIETNICKLKEKSLFSHLILFLSYYSFIIEFYDKNIEGIISVKELLLLKYIDMIKGILTNFDEGTSSKIQKDELLNALKTVNEKLHLTIKNIKEQAEMDLSVDLKTLQDLIKTDF
jgi:hypothetical protein